MTSPHFVGRPLGRPVEGDWQLGGGLRTLDHGVT